MVATAPLITLRLPSFETAYDDADALALETSRLPRLSKSKPNGVAPADAKTLGALARPSLPTRYVSSVLEAFSETTRTRPFGENCTCAGPALPAPSGCVEPAIGVSLSSSMLKPVMFPVPPAFRT